MKRELKKFVVLVVSLGIVGVAQAIPSVPILTIFDGVTSITITDNVVGDLNASTGELTMSTNIGVWSLSVSTGLTKPALGGVTNPVMDLVVQASSTGAGSLTYTFSDNSFTPPKVGGANLSTTVSGHVISGAPTTVDYSVYEDQANVLGAETSLLATTGINALPVLISNSGGTGSIGPLSLTQVVQLTASGASSVSVDASLSVVPEPSTVALTFVGLAFVTGGMIRRRRS